jgi:endogenous inhibitor of DNA gyrase (YacG/DUF329 family)
VKNLTESQEKQIWELRSKGLGYRSIASVLNLSRDIVRNYCKKKGLEGYAPAVTKNIQELMEQGKVCLECGKKIEQPQTGRHKKFCSDTCRRKWWKLNSEAITKKETAIYTLTCAKCGNKFESYGNKNRKYCSHDCYIKDRFYEEAIDGI